MYKRQEQEYARIKAGTAAAARPNDVVLLIDGQTATLGAFQINGSNYLKLRDVALLLEDVDSCLLYTSLFRRSERRQFNVKGLFLFIKQCKSICVSLARNPYFF